MERIKHILIAAMVLVMVVMFANANIPPAPTGLNNDTDNYWVNYTWSKDLDHPDNENVTDSFNVSMNDTWHNGTATFLDERVGPGGWANITVWAYNATGNGNMSAGSVSDSVQALSAATEHPHKCGYIPPPMDLSHLDEIPVKRIQAPGVLPDSFDWRDSGNVTPVKNQDPCGTCWTFGTTSVLESAVLINESAEYDFSEQSVALCVDRSWTYLYNNADDPCKAGGNSLIASEVFIKKGSVPESCNPYNGSALNCDGSCVCDDCVPVKRVDGCRLVTTDGLDLDAIKTAVYDHGPVTMSFYYDEGGNYTDETWGTIYDYYPCSEDANHLVSIIGWNDSVPHQAPDNDGTGAWIVKNSWGTGWGNAGYFYLAYNSSSVTEIAYLEYKDPVPDEELLYWDEAGIVGVEGYGDSGAWMASNFTADQSGNLTHVDFWTISNNAEYEIYVWDGFFGSELANQTGSCLELGYYSIPLSTPIPMDAGQQFTIGVNMTTPDYGYPIPVEFTYLDMVDPTIQTNVSFIRHNSSSEWTDLADHDANACLRARMVATFSYTCGDIYVNTSGWWREGGAFNDSYTPIQAAVDAAEEGETICVAAGIYDENVNIGTPHLTLVGEGADVVTVTATSTSDHVFEVTADSVNISGFTATGATNGAGIYLTSADNCVSDNTASDNDYGILLDSSSNNTLTSNTISDNTVGVYAEGTEYFLTVEDCEISDNDEGGIGCFVDEYLEVIIVNNDISNNDCSGDDTGTGGGIRLHGIDNTVSVINATIVGNDINNEGYDGGHVRVGYSYDYATANIAYVTLTDNYMEGGDSGSIKLHALEYLEVNATNNHFVNITGCCNKIGYADDDAVKDLDMTLVGNVFSADDGGYGLLKILADESITAIVTGNTFEGSSDGGTLRIGWVCNGGPLTAQNVTATIAGNTFEDNSGGAILTEAENDLDVEIYDNYINGTACDGERSAVEVVSSDLIRAEIYNNTITDFGNSGIYVSSDNTDSAHIFENDLSLGDTGIYLECDDCVIESNTMYDNGVGIVLEDSSNNTLTSNTASGNWVGIWLDDSSNYNTLTGNDASDNWVGIWLGAGMMMAEGVGNNTTSDNFGRRSPVSSNDTLADDDASDKGYSIGLGAGVGLAEGVGNNTLTSNTASGNWVGIGLYGSSNNTLTSNTASDNDYDGIGLYGSSNNTLYQNSMYNHSYSNAIDDDANNWNSSSLGNYYDLVYQTYMLTEAAYNWINTTQSDADWDNTSDNTHSPKVPIGFDFILDNVTYTHIQVVSNGVIQLIPDGETELNESSCASPTYWSTNYPDETFIFALCDGMDPDTGWYGYTTYTVGDNDSGNNPITQNLTVIDYHVATISAGNYTTNPNDYQVVLYEDGTMRFNFKNLNYTMFGSELYSGIYLRNSSSTYAKETIHVARAGQYSNETSYSTPIIRTLSSTYDDDGDGIADMVYPICGGGTDIAVDNYPLVTASKASSPASASSSGTVSFTVSTTVIDHASVGIDNIALYCKKDSGTWAYAGSTTGTFTFSASSGGEYYFYTVATDNCGKVEGVPSTYDSKTTVSVSSGGSSGGSGTYPPGWSGTPTPTVTATKAPAASATATDAQPDDKATPAPTKKPAVTKTTAPTAEGTTAGDAKKDAPGFTAIFVIAGMLAVAYAMMRRRE